MSTDTTMAEPLPIDLPPVAQAYLDAIASRLVGLDPTERTEMLADVREHLVELSAEPDVDLATTLGPPETYATELLGSAGLTSATEPSNPPTLAKFQRAFDGATAWVRQFRDDNPEVVPIWWALRGWLGAHLVAIPLGSGGIPTIIPRPFGSALAGCVLTLAAVAASIKWGRRTRDAGAAPRRSLIIASMLFGAVCVALGLTLIGANAPVQYIEGDTVGYGTGCLTRADGSAVQNLFPYDQMGKPLNRVLLYDERGQPLNDLCVEDWDADGNPIVTNYERDVNGAVVPQVFPRERRRVTDSDAQRWSETEPSDRDPNVGTRVPPPAIVVPSLAAPTTTTASTTTASTTAAPANAPAAPPTTATTPAPDGSAAAPPALPNN